MTFNLKPTQLHDFIAEFFIRLGKAMDLAESMSDKRTILQEGRQYLLGAQAFFSLTANGSGNLSLEQASVLGLLRDTLKDGLEYIAEKEADMNRYQFLTKLGDYRKECADCDIYDGMRQKTTWPIVTDGIHERRKSHGRRGADQRGRRATDA